MGCRTPDSPGFPLTPDFPPDFPRHRISPQSDLVPIDADDAEVLKADLLNPGMQGFGGSWRSLAPLAVPSPSGSSRFHLLLHSDSYRMERPVIRAGTAPAEDPSPLRAHCYDTPWFAGCAQRRDRRAGQARRGSHESKSRRKRGSGEGRSRAKDSPRPEEEGNRTPASRPRITRPPGPAGTPPARAAGGPRYPGVERSPCGGRRARSPACRAS